MFSIPWNGPTPIRPPISVLTPRRRRLPPQRSPDSRCRPKACGCKPLQMDGQAARSSLIIVGSRLAIFQCTSRAALHTRTQAAEYTKYHRTKDHDQRPPVSECSLFHFEAVLVRYTLTLCLSNIVQEACSIMMANFVIQDVCQNEATPGTNSTILGISPTISSKANSIVAGLEP